MSAELELINTANPSGAQAHINDLPDVLLCRILSLVGREDSHVTLVCKRFRRLFYLEPDLWRNLRLPPTGMREQWEQLYGAAEQQGWKVGDYVLTLQQMLAQHYKDEGQLDLLRRLHGTASSLDLRCPAPQLTGSAIDRGSWPVARLLRLLHPGTARELKLSCEWDTRLHLPAQSPGLGPKHFLHRFQPLRAADMRVLARFNQLEVLHLHSWQLPAATAGALAGLHKLRGLLIRTRHVSDQLMGSVLQLTRLEDLKLLATQPLPPMQQMTRLSLLTYLVLTQNNTSDSAMVPPSISQLPHLRSYVFGNERGPVQVDDMHVSRLHFKESQPVSLTGPELAVCLTWIHPQPLRHLWRLLTEVVPKSLPPLDRLQLHCYRTDISLAAVRGCSQLAGLRSLTIVSPDFVDGTDETLEAILQQAPNLTELCLSYLDTEGQLPACLMSYSAPLRALSLTNCDLTDVDRLGPCAEGLSSLDLSGNKLSSLPRVLGRMLKLKYLDLAGNAGLAIPSQDVDRLLYLRNLSRIDLRGARLWPADWVKLAQMRPYLSIMAESEEDPWPPV